MRRLFKAFIFYLCLALHAWVLGIPVDFDVIIVGSSPIPLIEALYHAKLGKRVAVLEASSVCGGAWKSIEICGLYPADLGCHTIGHDKQIMHFLQDYIGCTLVSIDNPYQPFEPGKSPNGFYFPHGCYELIQNLMNLIKKTEIVFLLGHPVESVFVNEEQPYAFIRTKDKEFTATKVLVTPFSQIRFTNAHQPLLMKEKSKFYHIYMLIEDPAPPQFSFRSGIGKGISRLMNLTHFIGLKGTGMQLIVFQTYKEAKGLMPESFFDTLKNNNLVSSEARMTKFEQFIYEQGHFQLPLDVKNASKVFEVLKTNHFQDMASYIPKWKQVFEKLPSKPIPAAAAGTPHLQ